LLKLKSSDQNQHQMAGHNENQPLSYEDHIIGLEEELTKTKNDLSKMSLLLGKAYVFTCSTTRENDRLKKRIEELEELELNHKADATRSVALTQEHSHHQHRAYNSPPMSPVSVPTSPRVHHPQHPQHPYQCSMAMACCDGLYFAPLRDKSSPPRLSPETPETPETPDTHQQADEYERDPAAYWQKVYPEWERKYNEERNKLEAEEAEEAQETNDY